MPDAAAAPIEDEEGEDEEAADAAVTTKSLFVILGKLIRH